jgi:hypothetical protein
MKGRAGGYVNVREGSHQRVKEEKKKKRTKWLERAPRVLEQKEGRGGPVKKGRQPTPSRLPARGGGGSHVPVKRLGVVSGNEKEEKKRKEKRKKHERERGGPAQNQEGRRVRPRGEGEGASQRVVRRGWGSVVSQRSGDGRGHESGEPTCMWQRR